MSPSTSPLPSPPLPSEDDSHTLPENNGAHPPPSYSSIVVSHPVSTNPAFSSKPPSLSGPSLTSAPPPLLSSPSLSHPAFPSGPFYLIPPIEPPPSSPAPPSHLIRPFPPPLICHSSLAVIAAAGVSIFAMSRQHHHPAH